MYNISKETFELMKNNCDQLYSGTLMPSKLRNNLMWIRDTDYDPLRDGQNDPILNRLLNRIHPESDQPAMAPSYASSASSASCSSGLGTSLSNSPNTIGCSSVPVNSPATGEPTPGNCSSMGNLSQMWDVLAANDGHCSFCDKIFADKSGGPLKHSQYDANGNLTCPLLLELRCSPYDNREVDALHHNADPGSDGRNGDWFVGNGNN